MKDFTAKNVEFESLNISGDQGNLNVFDAFKVGASGSVGDVSPTGVDDIIKWDGAKWIAGANPGGTGGGSGGTSVPSFSTALTSGEYSQAVSFGQTLPAAPSIATDLEIDGDGNIIPYTISGLSTTGYYALFAEEIPNNNYKIHTVFGGGGSSSAAASYWSTGANGDLISDDSIDVAGGIDFSGHILPVQNSQFDIGSAEYKIRHLYLSSNSLYIGDNRLSTAPDGAIDFPQGITTSGNISTTKDVIISGNLDFTNIGGTSPAEANDLIAWNGEKWTAQSAAALGLGGGGASSEVPNSFTTNIPNGSDMYAINWEPSLGVLDSVPRIAATVEIDGAGEIIPYTVSGVSTTGYHIVFSEAINTSNYRVHTVFGGKDVYWKTGASALSYTDNNVDISRNLYVGQNVGIGTTNPQKPLHLKAPSHHFVLEDSDAAAGEKMRGIFNNNNNLNLGRYTDDFNSFTTDLIINNQGNVGIGTTNPGAKLHIFGGDSDIRDLVLQYSGTSAYAEQNIVWKDFRGQVNASIGNALYDDGEDTPAASINFRVGDGTSTLRDAMHIKPNGYVGIGTTNPVANLEVYSATQAKLSLVRSTAGGGVDGIELKSLGDGSTINERSGIITLDTPASGTGEATLIIGTKNGSTDNNTLFLKGGNVGIGTTNPAGTLELSSTNTDTNLYMGGTPASGPREPWRVQAEGDYLYLGQVKSSFAKYMTFLGSNVGIGTTSPGTGISTVATILQIENNNLPLIKLKHGVGGSSEFYKTGPGDLCFAQNEELAMIIDSTGNVGIGTTNPGSYKLNVNGTARVSSGDVTSDDRVKHNEQPIIGALETLSKITPKKYIKTVEMYDANHDFELDADGNPIDSNGEPVEHRIEAGVIAQQVLTVDELAFAVSPEGVDQDGTVTSPHGLDYNSLFTYAIAAIQEQQQIIEDLKSRIETLEQ